MNKQQFALVPIEVLDTTVRYLQSRPWSEVNQIIKSYEGVKVKEIEPEKEPKADEKSSEKDDSQIKPVK